jgi:DNA polymerase III gamma/tau subunit
MVQVVLDHDRGGLIKRLQQLAGSGVSPDVLCTKLMERVRNLLVCKAAGWDETLLQLPDSEKDSLVEQAERFSELDLIRFYDQLNQTGNELRWHTNPFVHLEIALLKLVELAQLPAIESVIDRLENAPSGPLPPQDLTNHPTIRPATSKPSSGGRKTPASSEGSGELINGPFTQVKGPTGDPVQDWMLSLQDRFKSLYQQLQFASDVVYMDGKLTIEFPASEKFHAQLVEKNETQRKLSETFASIAGSAPDIDVSVVGEPEPERVRVNPMEDTRVQDFLKKFPGKVMVQKDLDE